MAWYGHTVRVDIDDSWALPKIKGRLSVLNSILATENDKIHSRMKGMGEGIARDLALSSQTFQRRAIEDLGAVDTGRLRDSVRVTGYGLERHIGTDLFYARTVHDIGYRHQKIFNINGMVIRGHSDIGPRPWTDVSAGMVLREIDGVVSSQFNTAFK